MNIEEIKRKLRDIEGQAKQAREDFGEWLIVGQEWEGYNPMDLREETKEAIQEKRANTWENYVQSFGDLRASVEYVRLLHQ